jgi:hypothetical protein
MQQRCDVEITNSNIVSFDEEQRLRNSDNNIVVSVNQLSLRQFWSLLVEHFN